MTREKCVTSWKPLRALRRRTSMCQVHMHEPWMGSCASRSRTPCAEKVIAHALRCALPRPPSCARSEPRLPRDETPPVVTMTPGARAREECRRDGGTCSLDPATLGLPDRPAPRTPRGSFDTSSESQVARVYDPPRVAGLVSIEDTHRPNRAPTEGDNRDVGTGRQHGGARLRRRQTA